MKTLGNAIDRIGEKLGAVGIFCLLIAMAAIANYVDKLERLALLFSAN